jgi:hypothetical protein
MKLIPVGFFRELSDDAEEQERLPSLRDALSSLPQDNEEKIVLYLRQGVCVAAIGRYLEDVLDPSCRLPLCRHLHTDGTYLWRLDVAHYVEKYHLRLPREFVEHMTKLNWQPPREEQLDLASWEV